jgi:hypothetical protein
MEIAGSLLLVILIKHGWKIPEDFPSWKPPALGFPTLIAEKNRCVSSNRMKSQELPF